MKTFGSIKFSYLYRDYGNFKRFGSIILSNNLATDLQSIRLSFSLRLIDSALFDPIQARVPPLFFEDSPYDPDLDHKWHEFDKIDMTNEHITDVYCRDIHELLREISA